MTIPFGTRELTRGSPQLGEMRDCNALLTDPDGLRSRLDEDGYLLVRGLIDRERVLAARRFVLERLMGQGLLQAGTDPAEAVASPQGGEGLYMGGEKEVTHAPDVRAVLEGDELFGFYRTLFGEAVTTFSFKWLRAVGRGDFTGVHYDTVYMGRGSERLRTCWVPFGDVPVAQGTLAVCEGSHRAAGFAPLRDTYGKMDVDRDRVKGDRTIGWFSNDPLEILEKFGGRWLTTDFRAGDVITFGMHTLHASTNNTTDRLRLSCDVRFQPAADVMDPRWVGEQPVGNPEGMARQQGALPGVAMQDARRGWGL